MTPIATDPCENLEYNAIFRMLEKDCAHSEAFPSFAKELTALVVIDPWAQHEDEGCWRRAAPSMRNLVRLIHIFTKSGRPIYYDASGLPIHSSIQAGARICDHFLEWYPKGGGTAALNSAHLWQESPDAFQYSRTLRACTWQGARWQRH